MRPRGFGLSHERRSPTHSSWAKSRIWRLPKRHALWATELHALGAELHPPAHPWVGRHERRRSASCIAQQALQFLLCIASLDVFALVFEVFKTSTLFGIVHLLDLVDQVPEVGDVVLKDQLIGGLPRRGFAKG